MPENETPVRPQFVSLSPFVPATSSSYASEAPGDPDREGAVDGEEGSEDSPERIRPGPIQPSREDRDNHCATGHAQFRAWCSACVQGRGRSQGHFSQDHSQDVYPLLSWDYGFLGSDDDHGDGEEVSEDEKESEEHNADDDVGAAGDVCGRCYSHMLMHLAATSDGDRRRRG